MSEFVIVVFPDEAKAYQGLLALQELHCEGSLTVYASAFVWREENGVLTLQKHGELNLSGAGARHVVGGSNRHLRRPRSLRRRYSEQRIRLVRTVSERRFLEETEKELAPGKYAVIAVAGACAGVLGPKTRRSSLANQMVAVPGRDRTHANEAMSPQTM